MRPAVFNNKLIKRATLGHSCLVFLVVVVLIWLLNGPTHAQMPPQATLSGKNILILHSHEPSAPVFVATDNGLSETLESGGIPTLNQFFESLDQRRNPAPEHRRLLVDQMRLRYKHRKLDMIITMYPEALEFVLKDCRDFLSDVPVLALYLPQGIELPKAERLIIRHFPTFDIVGTLEIALKLVPGVKRAYVVSGAHEVDRRIEGQARRELKKWEGRLEFHYLSDRSFEDMVATVAAVPADSIILQLVLSRDVSGNIQTSPEAARRLSEVSAAPIFGLLGSTLGHGITGGSLINFELIGRKAGELVLNILRGTQGSENIPAILDVSPVPMFDWRQLRRWNLSEAALPKGSIVINREVTFWDFKYYIIGVLAFCLLETVLIVRLIFQRRRKMVAEESLRQRTEELDQFFNVNLDILCVANTDGYFLRLNPAIEGILGYTRDELMARRFLDFVHPDDRDRTLEVVSALASQQRIFSFENRYRCKDGTYRWLQWSSAPVGKLIYAAARDVTGPKRAEENLRKSEERFRMLVETMNEGLGVQNENGVWTYVNDGLCWMLGDLHGDIIGRPATEFLDEANQSILEEEMRRQRKGNYAPYEITWTHRNGSKVTTIVSPKPVFNPEGQLKEVFSVVTDITERKRTEKELRKYHERLEEMVKERTAELVMARDEADGANRAKSTFLANMSHELRTPLNSILGVAQLMERDAGFPSQHWDTLKILSRSGVYLLELIDDVLEMSKIEAGKMAPFMTSLDLHSFLGDLEEMIRLRADQKGLMLHFEHGSPAPQYIETDVRMLRQILVNLLSNAIKFTEKGRVTLRFAFQEGRDTPPEAMAASLGHLKFEIEDTGIGIAPEDTQRIFEPFVQVNPGRAAREGTGLGLTLSRMLIEMLGGEITVRSQVRRGSIFAFDIPVKLAEAAVIRSHEGARKVIGLVPGQPSCRLLVVDDSIENRFVLRRLLEQSGFTVLEAADGQEAIDLFKSGQPHLIWMDVRMSGMDGYEAAQRIREEESGKRNEGGKEVHTPIIALTAGVMENQSASPLSWVFDDWVYKPFRETEIFDKLEKHLGVQFVYQPSMAGPMEVDIVSGKAALRPSDLSILSGDWLNEFSRTLRKGRSAQLLRLIDQIPPGHADLAGTLSGLVRIHQFDKLIAVTEGALRENSNG